MADAKTRAGKMYGKGEEAAKKDEPAAKKKPDAKADGGDAKPAEKPGAKLADAMKATAKRHEGERRDTYGNHRDELRKMQARHETEMADLHAAHAKEMLAGEAEPVAAAAPAVAEA